MLQDLLGRPIKKGDTVLVKSYGSCINDQIAIVDKVAPKNIYVYVHAYRWERVSHNQWKRVIDTVSTTRMPRNPKECLVINEQIAYNKEIYPEYFL